MATESEMMLRLVRAEAEIPIITRERDRMERERNVAYNAMAEALVILGYEVEPWPNDRFIGIFLDKIRQYQQRKNGE